MNLRIIFTFLSGFIIWSCSNDGAVNSGVKTSAIAQLYATTQNGEVKQYDINTGKVSTFSLNSGGAQGVDIDGDRDLMTIVSRNSNRLEQYYGIGAYGAGSRVDLEADTFGGSHLQSPRDLAVSGNFYVVSDNTDIDRDETTPEGRFFIYEATSDEFILRNVVTTKFKVWGIEFIGEDLYAAVDETNKVAQYKNFLESYKTNQLITANKIVAFQGLVRTHGMDHEDGIMVLTDIGETESSTDGALFVVENFEQKFSQAQNGFIDADQLLKIAGNNTLLGNPVNVIYDSGYNAIFVAEATNNGGRVLAFNNATSVSGNISPDLKYLLPGVSSVFFHTR
ncbi:hypothetical protein [Christiangramia aquimixticola]|uniref:hypothetical protein n=1 Tax=Christiangramia aquimixticola TaxID=1697558 RepID=UPI003AA7C3F6